GWCVVVCAGDSDIVALDRAHLSDVQALALRNPFDHVDQHDVAQFLKREVYGAACADVASAYNSYFASHGIGDYSIRIRGSPSTPRRGYRGSANWVTTGTSGTKTRSNLMRNT